MTPLLDTLIQRVVWVWTWVWGVMWGVCCVSSDTGVVGMHLGCVPGVTMEGLRLSLSIL